MANQRSKEKPVWRQSAVIAGFGIIVLVIGYWALDPNWHWTRIFGPRDMLSDLLNALPPLVRGGGLMALGVFLIGAAAQRIIRGRSGK
jgi:hypothetical protein